MSGICIFPPPSASISTTYLVNTCKIVDVHMNACNSAHILSGSICDTDFLSWAFASSFLKVL